IHAGGRGKGKFKELPEDAKGGVRLAFSPDEVRFLEQLETNIVRFDRGETFIRDGEDLNTAFLITSGWADGVGCC
ncbi:MAG: hypothetical protein AAGJ70_14130, partial [Pseudomonadota bacterium]